MSDARRVEIDTRGAQLMRALADTTGMELPQKAAFWLEEITKRFHRGPRDTWTSARDRAAEAAGIERSMAKRIWQRWRDMKDVSGEAVVRLMIAYEAMCEATEAKAAEFRGVRLELEGMNAAADQGRVAPDRGVGAPQV